MTEITIKFNDDGPMAQAIEQLLEHGQMRTDGGLIEASEEDLADAALRSYVVQQYQQLPPEQQEVPLAELVTE